jgi:hypothetical protein
MFVEKKRLHIRNNKDIWRFIFYLHKLKDYQIYSIVVICRDEGRLFTQKKTFD